MTAATAQKTAVERTNPLESMLWCAEGLLSTLPDVGGTPDSDVLTSLGILAHGCE
jgi:hypothetical protein